MNTFPEELTKEVIFSMFAEIFVPGFDNFTFMLHDNFLNIVQHRATTPIVYRSGSSPSIFNDSMLLINSPGSNTGSVDSLKSDKFLVTIYLAPA